MKNFNREAIQRMFDGRKGGGGGGTNNADLAGYATQMWVNQNYVSIEFFNRLFSIHGHDPEDESTPPTDISVLPNDMDSIVDSIESMVGFYTEEYLSALGLNPDSGSGNATTLYELLDVKPNSDVSPSRVYGLEGTSADNGKVLTYSTTYGKWIAASNGAGSGSVTSIDMTVPTGFSVSGAPITTYGTLAVTFGGSIAKNKVLASPANATGSPDWRTLVASDIPDLSATYASASDVTTLQGYFDNLGNANSANKLAVYSKTAWGQTYWTSGGVPDNISGDMTSVGDITASSNGTKDIKGFRCLEMYGAASSNFGGYIDFHYNNDSGDYTSRIIEDQSGIIKINNTLFAKLSGGVTIGTSTVGSNYKLEVSGEIGLTGSTKRIYFSDTNHYIELDSNGYFHFSHGLYSDSFVSAQGLNSNSGGSITLNEPLNGINNAGLTAPTSSASGQTVVWNGSAWTYSINTTLRAGAIATTGGASIYGNVESSVGDFIASASHGYTVTGKDNTYVLLAGGGTKLLSEIGGGGTVNSLKVGTTSYNPDSNGIVSIPAYPVVPTTVSSFTNDAHYIPSVEKTSGDFNTFKTCQLIGLSATESSFTNGFSGCGWSNVLVLKGYGRDTIAQIGFPYGSVKAYLRTGTDSSISSKTWREFAFTDSNVATATDADKLDGQHGSYYATASSVTTLQGYFTNGVANNSALVNGWAPKYWTAVIKGQTWSRLCYVSPYNAATGTVVVLNIQGTRGDVVYNNTYIITAHHPKGFGRVVKISGSYYSDSIVSVRTVSDNSSNLYIELYDNNRSISAATTQEVKCSIYSIRSGDITLYTSFTDGTTLPSGYSVGYYTSDNASLSAPSINSDTFIGKKITINKQNDGTEWATDDGAVVVKGTGSNPIMIGMAVAGSYSEIQSSSLGVGSKPLVLNKKGGFVGIGTTAPERTLEVASSQSILSMFNSSASNEFSLIGFKNTVANQTIYLGLCGQSRLVVTSNNWGDTYDVWNSGNDGSGSGLDADLLDGQHGSYYATASSLSNYWNKNNFYSLPYFDLESIPKNVSQSGNFGWTESSTHQYAGGGFVTFVLGSSLKSLLIVFPAYRLGSEPILYSSVDNAAWGNAKTLAYTSSNVASATKLQTSRTLWGQSFDGSGNVTGTLSSDNFKLFQSTTNPYLNLPVGTQNWYVQSVSDGILLGSTITKSIKIDVDGNAVFTKSGGATLTGCTSIDSMLYFDTTNSRIGVGVSAPDARLHVKGRIIAEYDDTHKGSFQAIRGDYQSKYGINSSGFAIITTSQTGASSEKVRISMTPYTNTTDPYVLVTDSLRVGGSDSNYWDGKYIQIGGARIVWDDTNKALKVIQSDNSTAANFYATGAVSALGANTSGGGSGSGSYIPLSGSNAITGSLIPSNTTSDLGQSASGGLGRWRKIWAADADFTGTVSAITFSATNFSASSLATSGTITCGNNLFVSGNVGIGYSSAPSSNYHVVISSRNVSSVGYGLQTYGQNYFDGNTIIASRLTVGQSSLNTSYKFYVSGTSYFTGQIGVAQSIDSSSGTIKLFVGGTVKALGYENGSDIRLKSIVSHVGASVDEIANSPVFNYTWNNLENSSVYLGTSAQYWQNVFPCAVKKSSDGYLSMDYGATALAAAVITARRVQNHEDRIRELEYENERLRNEIEMLKAA